LRCGHDASLRSGGSVTELSVTDSSRMTGGDRAMMPLRKYRYWSILLTFQKLIDGARKTTPARGYRLRPSFRRHSARSIVTGSLHWRPSNHPCVCLRHLAWTAPKDAASQSSTTLAKSCPRSSLDPFRQSKRCLFFGFGVSSGRTLALSGYMKGKHKPPQRPSRAPESHAGVLDAQAGQAQFGSAHDRWGDVA